MTIATLSTASHSITAAYTSGDTNFIPSPASTAVTQVVNKASTSTTVASSVSPSVHGQSVTFTATVSVVSPGSTAVASPTGTVTFYDNGTSIGTGTLSVVSGQDQATFTTSSLSTATHPITAAYTSGDGNFNASPVSAVHQPGGQQGQHDDRRQRLAGLRQRRADRDLHGHGHRQCAGLGHADRDRRLLRHHDQHRPDARRRGALVGHGHLRDDEPGGRQPHRSRRPTPATPTSSPAAARTGTVTIGQTIFVLDPSAGGALSLSGNASINIAGGVYVDSSSSSALSASGNASVKAVRHRRARRGPEERQRQLQPRAGHRRRGRAPTRSARCRSRAPPA